MPEITIKNGVISAVTYVQCTREYECGCGNKMSVTLNLPEGVSVNGSITIKDANCPTCKAPVVIPQGHHYIENFRLLTR